MTSEHHRPARADLDLEISPVLIPSSSADRLGVLQARLTRTGSGLVLVRPPG
jgi:hypothetical protein